MKRKIIYGLTLVISIFFVVGCGSDSKEDPIESASSQTINGYKFVEVINSIDVNEFKSYKIDFKLVKDDFAVVGAVLNFKTFDSIYGAIAQLTSTTDSKGFGSFTYNPPSILPKDGTKITIQYVYETVDADGNSKDLVQSILLSFNAGSSVDGRATTLSISYLTTTCDEEKGIIEHYNVHAVDNLSRQPVVGIEVNFSLINGVKSFNGSKVQNAKGTLKNDSSISFVDSTINFQSQTNIEANDNLIIFPSQEKKDIAYLGGWDINGVSSDLSLAGIYSNIVNTSDLTYIIGSEERILGGENGSVGIHTIAHVEEVDAQTDSNGFAYFDIVADPSLGGHTVTVEAHGEENGQRYGISKKEFLRTDDFAAPDVVIRNSGSIQSVTVPISIEPGCVGNQPLIDVPVSSNSFNAEPVKNCAVVGGNFHTDSSGSVSVLVASDGNITASDTCTLSWIGGAQSLGYEY